MALDPNLVRIVVLDDSTLDVTAVPDPPAGTLGTTGSASQPNTGGGSAFYYAFALRTKTLNAQCVATATSANNLYAGATLLSGVSGSPAFGTGQTVRFTIPVGSFADSVQIFKGSVGTGGTSLYLYSEFDLTRAAQTGYVMGGTFIGTCFRKGTLSGTGGTTFVWDDPDPGGALNGTGGTAASVNMAHSGCVLFLSGCAMTVRPAPKRAIPVQLASGLSGEFPQGYQYAAVVSPYAVDDNGEADVNTVLSFRYFRVWPRPGDYPTRFQDVYVTGSPGVVNLSGVQFYGAAKRADLEVRSLGLKSRPDPLFRS